MRRLLSISPPILLMPLLLLATGCYRAQSSLYSAGPAAHRIANMQWSMVGLFLVTIAVMWALIGWAILTRRGTLDEHAPVDIGGGQGWIGIGGMLIPFLVLFGLFVMGLKLLASFPIDDPHYSNTKPDILIVGHQWWWEVHYLDEAHPSQEVTTANEIHIPAGQPVTLELETRDVIHSFWVPSLHGKVDLIPGHPNYIRIEASQPGSYAGQCAEFCGQQHAHMRLLVIAQKQADFAHWIEGQRQPGAVPAGGEAVQGEQVFLNGPCSMCHTVRGTLAGGRVGPDLTHIGSRRLIGANSFPNNNAYLEAWVTHAQSLKPGAKMPNLTDFSGTQLRDLVAYLRQLQ